MLNTRNDLNLIQGRRIVSPAYFYTFLNPNEKIKFNACD